MSSIILLGFPSSMAPRLLQQRGRNMWCGRHSSIIPYKHIFANSRNVCFHATSITRCATTTPSATELTTASVEAWATEAPFLASLVNPPETVALEDATRTYRTMDVVEPCHVYDPHQPNCSHAAAEEDEEGLMMMSSNDVVGPIKKAHADGRLWMHVAAATEEERAANQPPAWFEKMCRDLFFRRGAEEEEVKLDAVAAASDPHTAASSRGGASSSSLSQSSSSQRSSVPDEVDPYLWLPFDLLDVPKYEVGPYTFPSTATYTTAQRLQLCLGRPQAEFVCIGTSYAFPQRWQIPTSMGTEPVRLLIDPSCPAPVVFVQLSPDFPPAMWLPVQGNAAAIRRVLSDFAGMAALHRDAHHAYFEERYATARRVMELQRLPCRDEGDVLRYMAFDARNTLYQDAPLREYRHQQEFFLGEYDDPERLLEHLDLCPFLFSIPHLRTVVDPHAEHMIPTIEGPGVATSLYRCIYSKALLLVSVQLSAEVKLPPQDPEAFVFMWKDSQVQPKMKIPVFVRVLWPDHTRMAAGGRINRRINHMIGGEFAHDVPVDAVMAVVYAMQWAGQLHHLCGVQGMRQRVAALMAAAQLPEPPKLYPGTREVPNPEYTNAERLGMHLQYLSQLGDPDIAETIEATLPHASAPVRMGCAKAALIAGERELFRRIVSSEPPGRMQLYMTKMVRKRKTRDLVDPEPRLLEDQYEMAAPLWTKRGTRIDRNTLEGSVDAARLR